MRMIKLTIEYDGTNYAGWQVQPNGITIQEVMEAALAKLLGHAVRLTGAGRTDAGVHAWGMVAAFATDRQLPLQAFSAGLNSLLPTDIAVQRAVEVPLGFHPRFDALGKHYRYLVHTGPHRSPLRRLTSWSVRGSLDVAAMRRAAAYMVGEYDYAAFRTSGCAAQTTVRTIWSVELQEQHAVLVIDVKGRGFLRNMVRIMVGTLVEIGLGRRDPASVRDLLQDPQCGKAGATAPAQGLCLVEVYYDPGAATGQDFFLDSPGQLH
jgi:tRNA pseudouridine38-40 synthase